ncbi:MAG: PQQ-binding-like beta-propeller repeat protein [Micromonosporaceae bacterium]|nr:PQQ-binding-like beta-propeller repeat protein [Micromonosporaceae bacterium]
MLGFARDQQDLYLVEAPESAQPRVTAYRLADGTVRWEAPVPRSEHTWLLRWEGVLLVQSYQATGGQTTVLDPGTGQELWSRQGGPEELLAGGHYLVSELRSTVLEGIDEDINEPPRRELTALDPATGKPLWTVPVAGWNYATGGEDSRYLVAYGGAGSELISFDLTTGERLASASASARLPVTESTDVQVVGSLVLLHDQFGRPPTLTAYDVATLSPRWTITDPGGPGFVWPTVCGDLLCLIGERPPRALDPASGALVWSADWFPFTDDTAGVVVSELAGAGLVGQQLLMTEHPWMHGWLIDAGTGEPALDLRDWRLTPARPEPAAGTGVPLLFQYGPERTVVGRLQPDLSGIRALGAIDVSPPVDCGADPGYVFCVSGTGSERPRELTVWRHRLP